MIIIQIIRFTDSIITRFAAKYYLKAQLITHPIRSIARNEMKFSDYTRSYITYIDLLDF
jgi:hypothetical protein